MAAVALAVSVNAGFAGTVAVLALLYSAPASASGGVAPFNPFKAITSSLPRLQIRIEKLVPCAEPDTPIQFTDLVLSQMGFNQYKLAGKINITKTFGAPIRLEIEIHKCADKDSCEYYYTFRKEGVCELLEQGDQWTHFTAGTDLPPTCPFDPKVYTIDGAAVDLSDFKSVPFFNSHWRLLNQMYQSGDGGDELSFCLVSEVSLEMVPGSGLLELGD